MKSFETLILSVILFFVTYSYLSAQDFISPVSSYSFDNGLVIDEMGGSNLYLYNNAAVFQDSERGDVLRFLSASNSYALYENQLLNTENATISFFFHWEDAGARSWHQVFELHNSVSNTNIFFTPQNGFANTPCSLISGNNEYGSYEVINGVPRLDRNRWMHVAVTFEGKKVSIYIDGVLASTGNMLQTPGAINANSLFLGGNPDRSNNFYITARLDEIKIFHEALAPNQVEALTLEQDIPEPITESTDWTTTRTPLTLTVDITDKKQTMRNFGSSDGWNTEHIGKYWPLEKKQKLAEMLFSTENDSEGNPKGIGLSSWRFNIGAGTSEQGDVSRITVPSRRTECFLNFNDMNYDWTKQAGQQWFLKEAVQKYNINHVIGWQNSPPVKFTDNNLGFRDFETPYASILKTEHYDDFAKFLADVFEHFESEGIHFDYISPLNEPQWGWSPDAAGGTMRQEGTPWRNSEIYDVSVAIDNELVNRNLTTKIIIGEAGRIDFLNSGNGYSNRQLSTFWRPASAQSLVDRPSFANIASYHSYFTDSGNDLIESRISVYNSSQLDNTSKPELWQTEYSLLQNGYREGYPDGYKLTQMECALSMAKTITSDLNYAHASVWEWWTTFEGVNLNGETRYSLIGVETSNDNTDGIYLANKMLYALGNYSRFIRPEMKWIGLSRSDNLTGLAEFSDVTFSAYVNEEETKLVMVAVNYTDSAREVLIDFETTSEKIIENPELFLTDEFTNLKKQSIDLSDNKLIVPPHSVITYTSDLTSSLSVSDLSKKSDFKVWLSLDKESLHTLFDAKSTVYEASLYNIQGHRLETIQRDNGQTELVFSLNNLPAAIYLINALGENNNETKKIIVFK